MPARQVHNHSTHPCNGVGRLVESAWLLDTRWGSWEDSAHLSDGYKVEAAEMELTRLCWVGYVDGKASALGEDLLRI